MDFNGAEKFKFCPFCPEPLDDDRQVLIHAIGDHTLEYLRFKNRESLDIIFEKLPAIKGTILEKRILAKRRGLDDENEEILRKIDFISTIDRKICLNTSLEDGKNEEQVGENAPLSCASSGYHSGTDNDQASTKADNEDHVSKVDFDDQDQEKIDNDQKLIDNQGKINESLTDKVEKSIDIDQCHKSKVDEQVHESQFEDQTPEIDTRQKSIDNQPITVEFTKLIDHDNRSISKIENPDHVIVINDDVIVGDDVIDNRSILSLPETTTTLLNEDMEVLFGENGFFAINDEISTVLTENIVKEPQAPPPNNDVSILKSMLNAPTPYAPPPPCLFTQQVASLSNGIDQSSRRRAPILPTPSPLISPPTPRPLPLMTTTIAPPPAPLMLPPVTPPTIPHKTTTTPLMAPPTPLMLPPKPTTTPLMAPPTPLMLPPKTTTTPLMAPPTALMLPPTIAPPVMATATPLGGGVKKRKTTATTAAEYKRADLLFGGTSLTFVDVVVCRVCRIVAGPTEQVLRHEMTEHCMPRYLCPAAMCSLLQPDQNPTSPLLRCYNSFPDLEYLKQHLRSSHPDFPFPFICPFCRWSCADLELYTKHVVQEYETRRRRFYRQLTRRDVSIRCKQCKVVAMSQLSWLRHRLCCYPNSPYAQSDAQLVQRMEAALNFAPPDRTYACPHNATICEKYPACYFDEDCFLKLCNECPLAHPACDAPNGVCRTPGCFDHHRNQLAKFCRYCANEPPPQQVNIP